MQHELTVGDVVQLKSGGPRMTIEGIGKFGAGSTHDKAKCVWFDGKRRMEDFFELPALSKVDDAPPPPMPARGDYL